MNIYIRHLKYSRARLLDAEAVGGDHEGEIRSDAGRVQDALEPLVEIRDDAEDEARLAAQAIEQLQRARILVPAAARAVAFYQAVGDLRGARGQAR